MRRPSSASSSSLRRFRYDSVRSRACRCRNAGAATGTVSIFVWGIGWKMKRLLVCALICLGFGVSLHGAEASITPPVLLLDVGEQVISPDEAVALVQKHQEALVTAIEQYAQKAKWLNPMPLPRYASFRDATAQEVLSDEERRDVVLFGSGRWYIVSVPMLPDTPPDAPNIRIQRPLILFVSEQGKVSLPYTGISH